MQRNEAKLLGELLGKMDAQLLSPCLDLGSSTLHFRTIKQPHIEQCVFSPLRNRGIKVIHADAKPDDGVDLVIDITSEEFLTEMAVLSPAMILCSNMMEHVEDREKLASNLAHSVKDGGLIYISVPYSYPYHPDPIDTYFRPTPDQIHQLIPGFRVLDSGIIFGRTFFMEMLEQFGLKNTFYRIFITLVKFCLFRVPVADRKVRFHRYLWLWKRYKISWVLLEKHIV